MPRQKRGFGWSREAGGNTLSLMSEKTVRHSREKVHREGTKMIKTRKKSIFLLSEEDDDLSGKRKIYLAAILTRRRRRL